MAWAALAVTAVLCVLTGQLVLGTWSPPASAGTTGCKDFFLISVMGSSEKWPGSAQDLSTSPETGAVKVGIDQALANAGKKLDSEVDNIDYPATAVAPMANAFKQLGIAVAAPVLPGPAGAAVKAALIAASLRGAQGAVASYLAGEQRGESGINDVINRLTRQCSAVGRKANFVLTGYSQGAMAVHNYLVNHQGQANVVGSVLIADPERTPNTGMHDYGDAWNSDPSSYGLCTALARLPAIPGRPSCLPNYAAILPIPAGLRSSTVDVCANNDVVCETSKDVDLTHPSSFGSVDPGYKIHINCNYYCGSPTHLAGQDMGRRLLNAGLQTPPVGSPNPVTGPDQPSPFTLSPTSGPAGTSALFRINKQCPAVRPGTVGFFRASDATKKIDDEVALNPDGTVSFDLGSVYIYQGGWPARGGDAGPLAVGTYQVSTDCVSRDSSGEETVTKSFGFLSFTVTGPPLTVHASASAVKRGGSLVFTPNSPCPAGARDRVSFYLSPLAGNSVVDSATPDASGQWSGKLTVPPSATPGQYEVGAMCDGPLGTGLIYGFREVVQVT